MFDLSIIGIGTILLSPCVDFLCFYNRTGLALMFVILVEGCSVQLCAPLRTEQMVAYLSSFTVCFCAVFAPMTTFVGIEYLYDNSRMTLSALAGVLGGAVLRLFVLHFLTRFDRCKKYTDYMESAKEILNGDNSARPATASKEEGEILMSAVE